MGGRTDLICSPAVTGRGPAASAREEGECGGLGLETGAWIIEKGANAPVAQRQGQWNRQTHTNQMPSLPDRSEDAAAPVDFICETSADRPSEAVCRMGAALGRPGGGVGSFLREASRLSKASARESKTSGCIDRKAATEIATRCKREGRGVHCICIAFASPRCDNIALRCRLEVKWFDSLGLKSTVYNRILVHKTIFFETGTSAFEKLRWSVLTSTRKKFQSEPRKDSKFKRRGA